MREFQYQTSEELLAEGQTPIQVVRRNVALAKKMVVGDFGGDGSTEAAHRGPEHKKLLDDAQLLLVEAAFETLGRRRAASGIQIVVPPKDVLQADELNKVAALKLIKEGPAEEHNLAEEIYALDPKRRPKEVSVAPEPRKRILGLF